MAKQGEAQHYIWLEKERAFYYVLRVWKSVPFRNIDAFASKHEKIKIYMCMDGLLTLKA